MISLVRQLIDAGHEVVLWTSRNGKELEDAVEWCKDWGLVFCAVNEPAPSNHEHYKDKYPTQSRKIFGIAMFTFPIIPLVDLSCTG